MELSFLRATWLHPVLLGLTYALAFSIGELRGEIVVTTQDGRVLTGQVDSKTSVGTLWIRHETEQVVLTTAVGRSNIGKIAVDGTTVDTEEFFEESASHASEGPQAFLANREVPGDLSPRHSPPGKFRPLKQRVVSVEIDAEIVNRDRDTAPDGLELWIAAIDEHGRPTPVRGSLTARLWGERIWPNGSVDEFDELQRWSQPVDRDEFCDGLARYYLPWRGLQPESDLDLRPEAMLNVRLGVYGQGNYQASRTIHIRHFNPLRDRLQLFSGQRFFPGELTGRKTNGSP